MKLSTLLFIAAMALVYTHAPAQDLKKTAPAPETKMEKFTSKTGVFHKFTDSKLPALKLLYGSAETRIRKISSGPESVYFYQIEKSGQYTSTTASIEYTDLLEVIKAVNLLKTEVEKDMAANPDYLENKFVTVDGFQVGYYVEKGKSSWYVKLEKYGADNTLFAKDESTIELAFLEAKAKIEDLRK